MRPRDLFERLAPLVGPVLEAEFHRRDLCILASRVALDVCDYFGLHAEALPVRTVLYNREFAAAMEAGLRNPLDAPGAWSVGVGFPPREPLDRPGWAGHLVVAIDDLFGDFSIRQGERLDRGIVTGDALVGPRGMNLWRATNDSGTVVEYRRTDDRAYRTAPDWKDSRRRKPISGKIIRAVLDTRC